MSKENKFILRFEELGIEDVSLAGGKNAALGEMVRELIPLGVNVPDGFAVTAYAYNYFLEKTGIRDKIAKAVSGLNTKDVRDLQKRGKQVRNIILRAEFPKELREEIQRAYSAMEERYGKNTDVAVRSSATAEDLPGASFAGQQETYLNVAGTEDLLLRTKQAMSSLFTDRAISYRVDKGFEHTKVALSVGVQKMVRSDLASSGIAFTIDTETGFDDVIIINASYGLGEMVVQGKVTPDEFLIFKPTLKKGYSGIIARNFGKKDAKFVYSKKGIKRVLVPKKDQLSYCLSDKEVSQLAQWCMKVEEHFSKKRGQHQPMDIEWAKDGKTEELFIVQARPETVQALRDKKSYEEYRLKEKGRELIQGIAVGTKVATGNVRVIRNVSGIHQFQKGEILVTDVTDPDWEPIMKIASAIVTDKGGRTSHAAIVSRELGIPAIVGTEGATKVLRAGKTVTVDCSSGERGMVYEGALKFEVIQHKLDVIPKTKTKIMVNIGAPQQAFRYAYLPVQGVGLGRLEFIINSYIKIHPRALIDFARLKSSGDSKKKRIVREVEKLTQGFDDKKEYYTEQLAEGIAKIGAAFWPHEVIIRFSDFKSNEYRALVGGELYEPEEANPMLGWRGASRYKSEEFKEAFRLECLALKQVREKMGMKNVTPMVPFCRTVKEGEEVVASMAKNGLDRAKDRGLKVYMMCEIPSNVISADAFLDIFDGMSIGSNDLTQLVLGLDRDSGLVAGVGNENNPAVKKMIADAIKTCQERDKYIGICGQAPSDYPEFTRFLVEQGIGSISLNPDVVVSTIMQVAELERER